MKEKEYEVLFIIKPHLSDEEYTKICDSVKKCIKDNKGDILLFNALGLKDLATPIKKTNQAYQILLGAYQTGKMDFESLLEIHQMRLNFQIKQAKSLASYNQNLAKITYLMTTP